MRYPAVVLGSEIAVVVAIAVAACTSAAGDVPRYVAGPLSGFIYDCQQAGQRPPAPETYLTRVDLDGDGQPDFIVDAGKGCKSNRDLYCNAEGCSANVYLSSASGLGGYFRGTSFAIVTHEARPAIHVTKGGPSCPTADAAECSLVFSVRGDELVPVK